MGSHQHLRLRKRSNQPSLWKSASVPSPSPFETEVALCWIPFFQRSYSRPETFACPGCPWVPLLGLTINGYMLSQCTGLSRTSEKLHLDSEKRCSGSGHWQAWLRLLATTFLILAAYLLRVRALYSGRLKARMHPDRVVLAPRLQEAATAAS